MDLLAGIVIGIAGVLVVAYVFANFAFTFISLGQTIRDLPARVLGSRR